MPLHARDPVGIADPFDGFDDLIGRVRGDAQILAGRENRLVVRAVDANFVCASELREARAGFENGLVMRLWALMAGPRVLSFGGDFVGNILDESAAEKNVQALRAVANREDGLLFSEGVGQDGEIGGFAAGIGNGAKGMNDRFK